MVKYRPRIIDDEIRKELDAIGAVVIEGPKWCGKTTTASTIAKSKMFLLDPETGAENRLLAETSPALALKGDNPRLIDEWQVVPSLWDAVRGSVDARGETGLYLLTRSTSVDRDKMQHSGAGRISTIKMGTMSLYESGDSTGEVSLSDLFDGAKEIYGHTDKGVEDVAYLVVRGGWPKSIGKSEDAAFRAVRAYCKRIVESDIAELEDKRRDPDRAKEILQSLSKAVSEPLVKRNIIKDIEAHGKTTVTEKTLDDYLKAFRRMYLLDEVHAWNPNLRSKASTRTTDIVHLCDPAVAASFMGASSKSLLSDLGTLGLLFESMVVRDLRAYTQRMGGEIYHYRDSDGLEADAVVHLNDGRWGVVEVRLGSNRVDEGADSLLKLSEKVDTKGMGKPSFLAVVTATKTAFTRPDGVHVIPLACLRD
ncbi:MAG: DUF4143 domain-containing protein [Thermoplasmata archaeon]|nr:DUF4143 domain-containing protein [Thermoplasmata archaeon]